jgi:pilus assembly protein CpaF
VSLLKRIEQGQSQTPQQEDLSASRLAELRSRRPASQSPAQTGTRDAYFDLKTRVQNKLLGELDPSMDVNRTAEVRRTIEELFENILAEESIALSRAEKKRLFEAIVAEILGFGPLEPLLAEEGITEIMVNGCKNVYIERKGKVERVPVSFESDEHVMRIIDRIVSPLGRRIDESSPYVDARLPDGSRVNAVIPPISLVGPVLTIRKFAKIPITVDDLIRFGSITAEAIEFLKACVSSRLNVVISGCSTFFPNSFPRMNGSLPSRMRRNCSSGRITSSPWNLARPISKGGGKSLFAISWSTRCACAPSELWSEKCATTPPWTCCRP